MIPGMEAKLGRDRLLLFWALSLLLHFFIALTFYQTRMQREFKIPFDKNAMLQSKKPIARLLKAQIAQQLFDDFGFYKVLNYEDNEFQKALEVLKLHAKALALDLLEQVLKPALEDVVAKSESKIDDLVAPIFFSPLKVPFFVRLY